MPLVGGAAATVAEPSTKLEGTGVAPAMAVATPPVSAAAVDPLDEPSGVPVGPEAPTDELDRSALSRALRRSVELAATPIGPASRPSLIPAPSTGRPPQAAVPNAPTAKSNVPAIRNPLLVVIRGERQEVEYRVMDGRNYIGRSSDRGVDIDLTGQEPVEQTWTSRQHALLTLDRGTMTLEDMNSLNGTFVNRVRIHPGQQRTIQHGDVIQVGTVQLKVVF